MKKQLILLTSLMVIGLGFTANAQTKPNLKKETIISSPVPSADEAAALKRPVNSKGKPAMEDKSRGDVYGPDYSDVVIDNWTGYYLDIYVNGDYRGTVAPWEKKVTWGIPGTNRLYAKAVFDDGSYLYWGPKATYTGYQYTWKLNP
ncbi:MAG: hypothetical protein ABIP79_00410 [Chitinophagaceae bacterium]